MEAAEIVNKFREFIETNYQDQLLERTRKGINFIVLDFLQLSKYDIELAEELLEEPEETIAAAELAIKQFDLPKNITKYRVRFKNLPETQKQMIRNIRSKNLGKFYIIDGIVRQKSDVRPQVTSARFECPSCGNIITVLQLDTKFKEPSTCGCGRKGKFRLLSKELIDAQAITLEEAPEDLEGGEQPKRLKVFLKDDLVSPISEKHTNPGSKVSVIGIIKEIPLMGRDGGILTRFDLIFEANHIEAIQEDYLDLEITEEEENKIKEISKDPKSYEKLVNSIAPSVYGYDKIKEALLLQLAGGVKKTRKDGMITRGDMHILLIGDPGAGKCVSGETKIMLSTGEIIKIQNFIDQNCNQQLTEGCFSSISSEKIFSINEKCLNFSSTPKKLWMRKHSGKMLKITTSTGNEITVTPEHPLFTTINGLVFAKKAEEFKTNEFIATPSQLKVEGSIQTITKKIKPSKARNKVRYDLPAFFTQDFARFFGYLVGDGYVRQTKTTGIISLTNNNKELLNDFEQLTKTLFGLKVSKRLKQDTKNWEYYFSSIEIVRILENIDPNITKKSDGMCINKHVTKSPNYIVKEFIKSLYDCEGHVRKDRCELEFSTKSKELAEDLKLTLLRFGIISQLSSALKCATNTKDKIKRRYYRLRISGEDCDLFYNQIGFKSTQKMHDLNKVLKQKKDKHNTNKHMIPNVKELLTILRKQHSLSQFSFKTKRSTYQHYEKGDRNPSKQKLKEICQEYNKLKSKNPLIKILEEISNANIFWDKIKKIETINNENSFVYDLEIERVHNFVANGVIIHNSQLLKRAARVAPKSRYVSGKGVSGAGLTASVVKDEFLGGWALEAGALPLCNRGFCMIDELDKMSQEDTAAMHEALEGQTITISKANIQATLRAETTVLAAANPKFGRFDPYDILAKQINLPPTLINRFDLIFPVKDVPDEKNDDRLAKHVLSLHQNPEFIEPEIETELLRKYIAYVRQKCHPKLTDAALTEIRKYYVEMRNTNKDEAGSRAVPISARQLEGLVRLSEARAKIRLADKVTKEDARKAIELVHYCLQQVGLDPETGKIDIDRITTGITTSQRTKIFGIKDIIVELENKLGKVIPIEDIIKEAVSRGMDESAAEEAIEKLKRSGDVFEPKHGFLSRI